MKRFYVGLIFVLSLAFSGASIATADESAREFLPKLVGKWIVSGTVVGLEVSGTIDYRWADGEYALFALNDGKIGDYSFTGRHVVGFDSVSGSIRSLGFYSSGLMEDLRFERANEDVGKGTYSGSADGKNFEGKLTVTFSKNSVLYETKGMKLDGKPSPELSLKFTKIQN